MDDIEILKTIAAQNNGVIRNKAALICGIQRHVLAKLCTDGILQRVTRGRYIFSDDTEVLLPASRQPKNT